MEKKAEGVREETMRSEKEEMKEERRTKRVSRRKKEEDRPVFGSEVEVLRLRDEKLQAMREAEEVRRRLDKMEEERGEAMAR